MHLIPTILFFFSLFFSTVIHAQPEQEKLGVLKIDQFFLEPTFSTDERTYSQGFSIGRSYIGASWTLDNVISAHFVVGPKFMIGKPSRYGFRPSRDLGIIEAYGQLDSGIGTVRAGLIPVPFGSYSLTQEGVLTFPDTLFEQALYIPKRDYGGSYYIDHNNFVTVFAVHNGESDPDEDRRYWITGRWSYKGPAGSEVGVSGSTGRSVDLVTLREQRIRAGNIFGGFKLYGLGMAAEAGTVSTFEQGNFTRQAFGWHIDLEHPLWNPMGLQLRYDYLEPHHGVINDQIKELTYGINYYSRYKNSVLYVLGTTRWEEGSTEPHTGAQVVWKLNPLSQQ